MPATVVLTRPALRNQALAQQPGLEGARVLCLPALELTALVADPAGLPAPAEYDLVVFVSSYAAQLFLDIYADGQPHPRWPAHTLLGTVGLASARPLLESGWIPASQIVYPEPGRRGQDSEGFWEALQPRVPTLKRVLIVRGRRGRPWLGEQFDRCGIHVDRFALYDRLPARWSDASLDELGRSMRGGVPPVFLLTSIEGVRAVQQNLQRAGLLPYWPDCRFVVIHVRIAERLQSILQEVAGRGAATLKVCEPSDQAIGNAIQALLSSQERH